MTKYKHQKRNNTSFLYEVLVLELAKSVLNKNKELKKTILETIKKFFNKSSILNKELRIYKEIVNINNVDSLTAERILFEAKKQHDLLDKEKLIKEQTALYAIIKKIAPNAGSNFVPNYKDLASLSQIFNRSTQIQTRVLLENQIIEKMSKKGINEEKMIPIDNLVLNSYVKNYNEKYSFLSENQKTLLNKYIMSFIDNGVDFKVFLSEEIKRLKEEVKKSLSLKEINENEVIKNNTKSVISLLESFSSKQIDEKMISQIIKIQSLVNEIK